MKTGLLVAGCVGIVMSTVAAAEMIDERWSLATAEESYENVVLLQQVSTDAIPAEDGPGEINPVLEFRCTEGGDGTITFRIDWRRFISSFSTEVGFRVDGGKATWLKLAVDESNAITLSTSGSDAAKLIEKMQGGQAVVVEVSPYSQAPLFVGWSLAGFDTALEKLSAACE